MSRLAASDRLAQVVVEIEKALGERVTCQPGAA